MKTRSLEPAVDTLIADLHRIREELVDAFGGDLAKLTADARQRQAASGAPVWRRADQLLPPEPGAGSRRPGSR